MIRMDIKKPWFITCEEWNSGTLGVFENVGARHLSMPQQEEVKGGGGAADDTGSGEARKESLAVFIGEAIIGAFLHWGGGQRRQNWARWAFLCFAW
mmetsp:Transcript_12930/g.25674  ORF Transcript_12930/g.25674 Transcript_12930/m.25674 type:complete len:96 (+) Transcript_12930:248-535(+)